MGLAIDVGLFQFEDLEPEAGPAARRVEMPDGQVYILRPVGGGADDGAPASPRDAPALPTGFKDLGPASTPDPYDPRVQLAAINALLSVRGLPTHDEPKDVPPFAPSGLDGFPYSFLHTLRRVMALHRLQPGQPIEPMRLDDDDYTMLDAFCDDPAARRCHLVLHADNCGYYFPIDIDEVVSDHDPRLDSSSEAGTGDGDEAGGGVDDVDDEIIEGGFLGSSLRLAEELREIAPLIGIALDGETVPPEVIAENERLVRAGEDGTWFRERTVWLTLYEAALHSSRHRAAIVFC
ncbi:MAG: hypothetical protein AAF577_09940 [Pseudomonadota bacterium]